ELRPNYKTLPAVPYKDWSPNRSYKELPPFYVGYIMEWKLTLNKRAAAKQTEENIAVAPGNFWNNELASKIVDLCNRVRNLT
ncbi:hypothetical protein QBC36DRAFT_199343, partial [Triangularia setosa]